MTNLDTKEEVMAREIPRIVYKGKLPTDTLDWQEIIDLERHGLSIQDLLEDVLNPAFWGPPGIPIDPKATEQSCEIEIEDDDCDYDEDEEEMPIEDVFTLRGQEEAEDYLTEKYQSPRELDFLYEFDLKNLFPHGLHIISLTDFVMTYSRDKLPEFSYDDEYLLRDFDLTLISTSVEFAVNIKQAQPS